MSLKTIKETVGAGGANIPADVATVQYLLNCVPVSHGGPIKELKIDGFAGVVTIEAIRRFQEVCLGASNSRVESSEQTFSELKKYDPLPFSSPVVPPNFKPLTTASMDPSKMNKSIEGGGIKRTADPLKRVQDPLKGDYDYLSRGIKRNLYGGVKDPSI